MAISPDDEVVVNDDVERSEGFDERAGHRDIILRGLGVAAWMIVRKDDGGRVVN